jgi:uncharacterized protein (TIGR03435 family)
LKITLLAITVAGFSCFAQSADSMARFEVASVKLGDPLSRNKAVSYQMSPGSLTTRALPLRACIMLAYKVMPAQIIGPDWLDDVRLDIVAKAATPVDEQQLALMFRTLLTERLGVKTHTDRKEMPVYVLTLAKGGPKFSPSTTEGPLAAGQDKRVLTIRNVSMFELAMEMSGKLFDRPLVDATGLKGRYDIRIDASDTLAGGPGTGQMEAVNAMIQALQEQLGLKAEARKDWVDVLIVDHADKTPTAN